MRAVSPSQPSLGQPSSLQPSVCPTIGITTCIDRGERLRAGRDYLYVARAYATAVRQAGGLPVLVSPDADPARLVERVDALIITGGEDLPRSMPAWDPLSVARCDGRAPSLGGFEVGERGRAEDAERIEWDRHALHLFAAWGKPVLGICYGMQLMNVHFGGTLVIDVRLELPGAVGQVGVDHGGGSEVTSHGLAVVAKSALLVEASALVANSCHRQAVAEVAPGFVVTARSPDGVVEAIERDALYGVQWHPETDPGSAGLWTRFVQQCGAERPPPARRDLP